MQVIKSSGITQEFNPEKIKNVLKLACVGTQYDYEKLYHKISNNFEDNMETKYITNIVTSHIASMISLENSDMDLIAGRLAMMGLRKKVFGTFSVPSLYSIIKSNVSLNLYDSTLLEKYTEDDINYIESFINHDNDFNFKYAGSMQIIEKYLVQDRSVNKIFETPQIAYICGAMFIFANEDSSIRMNKIQNYYNFVASKKISLPTPILAGVRTTTRQFSSCCVIDCDDSLQSINDSSGAIINYISKRAGIGINGGRLRAEGSKIRSGEVKHTGVIPFWKHFHTAVKSCCLKPDMYVEILISQHKTFIKAAKIKIGELKIGDKVLTKKLNTVVYKPVTDIWNTVVHKKDQIHLIFENGCEIHCSVNHPIMVIENFEQIQKLPLELTKTDNVISENGITHIKEFAIETNDSEEYIDITVQDTHTFFTSSTPNSEMILTHNSQGGVRGGAATLSYPLWHLEVEKLLVLKNNKGIEETRIRHMDYSVAINNLMINKLIDNEYISLFSPDTYNNELYESYYSDQEKFKELYEKAENDPLIRKQKIKATELFSLFMQERSSTGRIYPYFVSNVINQNMFIDPIYLTNLCCISGYSLVYVKADGTPLLLTVKELYKMMTSEFTPNEIIIKSFDEKTNTQVWSKIDGIKLTNQFGKVVKVLSSTNDSIICTYDHRIYTKNRGWVYAETLEQTDTIMVNGVLCDNTTIEYLDKEIPVYDISVQDTNCFYANNILVHNCEITLPTKPVVKDEGEIALCILSAINVGEIESLDELEEICYIVVNVLDNLIDIQDYPVDQAKEAINRRSLGVGITNFAYYLAKNYTKYSDGSANLLTHQLAESMQYYLLKASNKLAKEKGPCGYFKLTKYSQGILPIDNYNKNLDKIFTTDLLYDWESLRSDIVKHGLRNSVLSAQMPCESSSQVSNSTNGLEPVRSLVTIKKSKDGPFNQLAPEAQLLKDEYELAWDMAKHGMKGYLTLMGIFQKFIDQAISSNTYYDPDSYENRKVPMSILIDDLCYSNFIGLKTLYYHNLNDGQVSGFTESPESDCESCKI